MAIEPEENAGSFHEPFPREVHAPVDVFVGCVVGTTGHGTTDKQTPTLENYRCNEKGHLAEEN